MSGMTSRGRNGAEDEIGMGTTIALTISSDQRDR